MNNAVIIIPARYKSSRLPGKPLVDIRGKSMIRRTWEQCTHVLPENKIYVATDDQRIVDHCAENGMQSVMTGEDCLTGTDRVYQAALQIDADIYINVQGDEPLMNPDDARAILKEAQRLPGSIVCGMCPITDRAEYLSPMIPKMLAAPDGRLLYMSRGRVPANKDGIFRGAMRQVCIYAYTRMALEAFTSVSEKTPLEEIEDLELLRFLEMGYEVRMIEVSDQSIAVDVLEDVAKVEAALDARGLD